MDLLRSCYSTEARFFEDTPTELSPITWYWCPVGALDFPEPHRFGSLNWTNGSKEINSVGEVIGAPRPYSKGAIADLTLGNDYDGDLSWFQRGEPITGPGLIRRPSGIPENCAINEPNACIGATNYATYPHCLISAPGYGPVSINQFPIGNESYQQNVGGYLWDFACSGPGPGVGTMFLGLLRGGFTDNFTYLNRNPTKTVYTFRETSSTGSFPLNTVVTCTLST